MPWGGRASNTHVAVPKQERHSDSPQSPPASTWESSWDKSVIGLGCPSGVSEVLESVALLRWVNDPLSLC